MNTSGVKTAICLTVILFASTAYPGEWTKDDTVLEVVWQVGNVLDLGTTLDIENYPGCYETNPLLGRHPSGAEVIAYMAGWSVLHPLLVWALPERVDALGFRFEPRRMFQSVSIGLTGSCVVKNFRIGLNFAF